MKKPILMLLCFTFISISILASCNTSEKNSNAYYTPSNIIPQENLQDYSDDIVAFTLANNGDIFTSSSSGHIIHKTQNNDLLTVYYTEKPVFNLTYDDGFLYGYVYSHSHTDECNEHEPHTEAPNYIISIDLNKQTASKIPLDYQALQIRGMACNGDYLYLLSVPISFDYSTIQSGPGISYMSEEMLSLHIPTGNIEIIDLGHITSMYQSQSGKVYVYGKNNSNFIAEVNFAKNQLENFIELAEENVLAFVYEDDKIIYSSAMFQGINQTQIGNGGTYILENGISAYTCNDIQIKNNAVFVLDLMQNVFQKIELLDEQASNGSISLRIDTSFSSNPYKKYEFENVAENNSDEISFLFSNNYNDISKMATDLTSGAANTDIFIINTSWLPSLNVTDNNLYYPLNGDNINYFYTKSHDWIKGYAQNKSEYWMLPISIDASMVFYQPELMQANGIETNVFTSFTSMLNTANSLLPLQSNGNINALMANRTLAYRNFDLYFYNQHNSKAEPNFNTPEFEDALNTIKIFNDNMNFLVTNFTKNFAYGSESNHFEEIIFAVISENDAYRYKNLMSHEQWQDISGKFKVHRLGNPAEGPSIIDMDILFINKTSPYAQQASEFINLLAESIVSPRRESPDEPAPAMLFKDVDSYTDVAGYDTDIFSDILEIYADGFVSRVPAEVYAFVFEFFNDEADIAETMQSIDIFMKDFYKQRQ